MPKQKKAKYHFVSIISCKKCGVVVGEPGPCMKCKGTMFKSELKAIVKKEVK